MTATIGDMWEVYLTNEVNEWLNELADSDEDTYRQVAFAIGALAEGGPTLGRPLVDRIKGSSLHNLKELRPGSTRTSEIRILFAFDPWRSSVLLVAGDKRGRWKSWYRQSIPRAEQLFATYLRERTAEEGS